MSNQEVKVGQVYVGEITGTEYTVISVDSGSAELSFVEKVKRTGFEAVKALIDGEVYKLKDEASPSLEYASTNTTSLRDHFAGLAMQGLVTEHSNHSDSLIANKAYHIADAMLKARGE